MIQKSDKLDLCSLSLTNAYYIIMMLFSLYMSMTVSFSAIVQNANTNYSTNEGQGTQHSRLRPSSWLHRSQHQKTLQRYDINIGYSYTKPVPVKVLLQLHALKYSQNLMGTSITTQSLRSSIDIVYVIHQVAKSSFNSRKHHGEAIIYIVTSRLQDT